MKKLSKFYRCLFLAFPAVLYFSYFPIIALGSNETMNFELSLPLISLVIFDIISVVLVIAEKKYKKLLNYKWWLLFPIWTALSVFWSLNTTRAILTAGMLWAIVVAGLAIVLLKDSVLKNTWKTLKKVIYVSSGIAILWCIVQCILDLVGVSSDYSLLCAGCTKEMFGFPHPNGFAIEPQFMGNLLLLPALLSAKDLISSRNKKSLLLATVFAFGVFLTFSRGAIYAFIIGLVAMAVFRIFVEKKKGAVVILPVTILAFVLALNAQGMMSAFSGLGETYNSGINKVINHLSLGVIDIKAEKPAEETEKTENKPIFDGYVAESTDTRVRLTNSALQIWSSDAKIALIGVGVGGAGQALSDFGLSLPKEIIQNEYASVLLETGAVGFILFIFTIGMAYVVIWKKSEDKFVIVLLTSYLVTLFFFSGYPNALHIYLLPVMLGICLQEKRLR